MTYTLKDMPLHPGIPPTFRKSSTSNTTSWREVRRRRLLPDVVALRTAQGLVREIFSPIPEEREISATEDAFVGGSAPYGTECQSNDEAALYEEEESPVNEIFYLSPDEGTLDYPCSICFSENSVRFVHLDEKFNRSEETSPVSSRVEQNSQDLNSYQPSPTDFGTITDTQISSQTLISQSVLRTSTKSTTTTSSSSPTLKTSVVSALSNSNHSRGQPLYCAPFELGSSNSFSDKPVEEPPIEERQKDSLCCTLSRMRQILAFQDFLREQFESLQDELERRREECIQLRTVLANRATEQRNLTQSSYGKDVDIVNEDGELVLALQSQKQINRQLMEELNEEKARFHENEAEYRSEVNRLRQQNERQQELIGQNLMKGGGNQAETLLQSEIMRLTSENLNLQGQVDSLTEQLKKYKRTLKVYSKKLKEAGGGDPPDLLEADGGEKEALPVIRKKDREYMGMFEYDRRDEMVIIKTLIYELKPRVAVTLLPGLPSYILFMCIRHTDHINDDEKVRSLLNNIVNGVKRVIKKRHEDLDSTVLWLSNTLRLLHTLKQYSGEKTFEAENTPKQNEQSLRNFDLSEYRQVLSDIGVWIYNGVIKLMEEKVQPLIVPAILEHEAITGLSGNKPGGMRGRAGSVARELESPVEPQKALDLLLKELTQFYRTLAMFGTDPEMITQVFRQIFYFICAGALNNLLLRKDMCHWSKGMQIRYNLSHLEQWTRDMRLHEAGVTDTLAPIIQAAQILQARKTDDDVNSICDMCDKLTVSQIIKILTLYTPADDYEERVPISFIHKIQAKLQERAEGEQAQQTLLMNTKFAFPIRFPFNPSSIRLEDIELPDVLNLAVLKKI